MRVFIVVWIFHLNSSFKIREIKNKDYVKVYAKHIQDIFNHFNSPLIEQSAIFIVFIETTKKLKEFKQQTGIFAKKKYNK